MPSHAFVAPAQLYYPLHITGEIMETFKELWGAFRGQLADRMANPFAGAFAIAWVTWNFRLLVVFVWVEPYREKFQYIDSTLYPHIGHWALRGFFLPVATAYAYLFLYAQLTTSAVTYYRKKQSDANNQMRAAAGEALMTFEENEKALRRLAQGEAKWRQERSEMSAELTRQAELNNVQREQLLELQRRRADQEIQDAQLATLNARSKPSTGTELVFSERTESDPNSDFDIVEGKPRLAGKNESPQEEQSNNLLRLRHPNPLITSEAGVSAYTPRQLTILELLRNGAGLTTAALEQRLGVETFEIKTDVHKLSILRLLYETGDKKFRATDAGLVLLRAFIEEDQWQLKVA